MTNIIDAQQRKDAIQPHASYLVQAPAGSGKTELLIQRILALLATVEHPEEILALTFTRKAAAEMRERVLLALQYAEKPQPKENHAQTTWLLAKAVLKQSDEKGWRLTSYPAQLRIMTIDAFASGLARQLPVLSGFGQTPTTADFTEPLYQSAVTDLIQYAQQRNAAKSLQQAMNTLILHLDCNISKLSSLLCAMLSRREQWLPDVLRHTADMDKFKQHLEACLETVIEHTLLETYEALPEDVRGRLPALICFAEEQLAIGSPDKNFLEPIKGLTTFPLPDIKNTKQWQAIVELLLTAGNKADFRKQVNKNQGFPTGDEAKLHKSDIKECLDTLQGNKVLLQQLLQIRLLPDSAQFDRQSWSVLEALFITLKTLAGQLWQTFGQHKKVDFVEIMLRAKQALGQYDEQGNIIPSEALLRLDHQIKHILVDEFQDTATLQIDLLSRLTAGWNSDGRTLFMVGDPMQSIYRFRKAEVSLFLKAANNELALPDVTSLALSQNFRSSPDIVNWVNRAFFHILPAKDDIFAGAISYTASQAFKSESGQVKLNIFRQRDDVLEAEKVIAVIQQASSNGKKVGILARNRGHLRCIMTSLQSKGIPFRALEMLPLHQQPEIIDLRTLTCALLHPADHVAWAGLLRSPAVGLSLPSLHKIFNQKPISAWFAIQTCAEQTTDEEDSVRLQQFITALSPAIQQSGRLPIRKLVESSWLKLNIPGMLNQAELANSDSFFRLLEQIEDEGQLDITLLDKRLEKLFAKPESQPHAEQVELMTMHGAKGLQWDTVILPGLGKTPRPKDKEVLVQTETNTHEGKQLLLSPMPQRGLKKNTQAAIYELVRTFEKQRDALEVARLLYVACTRAEHELHLFGHVSEQTEEPASSSLLALLWQSTETCFGAKVELHDDEQGIEPITGISSTQPTQRIDLNYIPPKPQPSIQASTHHNLTNFTHRPEFSWAGASAKAVGIALHAGLQHLAGIGIENWNKKTDKKITTLMHSILLSEGISQQHINKASQRCRQGLQNSLKSTQAQWILSSKHFDQHNEWALTYVEDKQCKHIILDRSFIDENGTRWVIDYKTGGHEGTGLEEFLDHELVRYTEETPQLPNYVKALKALEPDRKVKAALYFPMVDGWRVWNDT